MIRKDGDFDENDNPNLRQVTPEYVEKVNNLAGIRFWSKSDFDARFIKDIMAIVKDAGESGFKAQAYTKRDDFAYLMKDTGVKILRSGIPRGEGYEECDKNDPNAVELDGKYYRLIFDGDEGIDFNDPNVIDTINHRDIGCNIIGISEKHMAIAQKDPRICQIIPLHSKVTPEGLQRMIKEHGWSKFKDGERLLKGYTKDGEPSYAELGHLNFYTEVLNKMDPAEVTEQSFCEKYLDLCHEKGIIPRCAYGLERVLDENGQPAFWPPTKKDIKNGVQGQPKYRYKPGYSKYLMDGKFFEYRKKGFGTYYPQKPIKPNFDRNAIRQIIENRHYEISRRRNLPLDSYRDEALRQIRKAHKDEAKKARLAEAAAKAESRKQTRKNLGKFLASGK